MPPPTVQIDDMASRPDGPQTNGHEPGQCLHQSSLTNPATSSIVLGQPPVVVITPEDEKILNYTLHLLITPPLRAGSLERETDTSVVSSADSMHAEARNKASDSEAAEQHNLPPLTPEVSTGMHVQ